MEIKSEKELKGIIGLFEGFPLYQNRVYKHFKGDFYLVEGIAKHSETGEHVVIYRALYEDNELYVRPANMFCDEVNKNGQKHRFELTNIPSNNVRKGD